MEKAICVYSSSSDAVDERYFKTARELGKLLGQQNYTLIYGGASIGLMGAVARSVHEYGGKVIGVIPEALSRYDITYEEADHLIVTDTMRKRKALMEEKAGAFIGLPGGFGTLEEIMEIITLKQLQMHSKPIVILNTGGFFDDMINMFERIYREKFAKSMHRQLYFVTADAAEAMDYINRYTPPDMPKKWF
jgi:uncharacterized protein (TIGR00730 family)